MPSAFCIHIPFLFFHSIFFMLSLYYKIAKYQCWHASSDHLGVNDSHSCRQSHVYCWRFLLNQDLLHSVQCWKTAKHNGSTGRYQLCQTHGQIRHVFSLTLVLSIAVAVDSQIFFFCYYFFFFNNWGTEWIGERRKRELSARGPAEWGWWPDFKHTGGTLWPL